MEVFDLIPYPNETLAFVIRDLDPARTVLFSAPMTEMPGFGEYSATVVVPNDVTEGNYKVEIENSNGVMRRVGYMRIVNETEYHFVNDFGDFNREVSTEEIENQLDDEFDDLPTRSPNVR